MKTNNNVSVIRDSINGENKYARIPIQRRRTPICENEIKELEKLQTGFQIDLETFSRLGCLISDLGFPYFAGKIFSYIDMQRGKEFQFVDFWQSEAEKALAEMEK